jgi:hypothetical protein
VTWAVLLTYLFTAPLIRPRPKSPLSSSPSIPSLTPGTPAVTPPSRPPRRPHLHQPLVFGVELGLVGTLGVTHSLSGGG